MPLHFLSHPWDVQNVDDGILVTCTRKDLDAMTVPVLVDELFELVLESGARNLHLDFAQVRGLASVVIGKLIALDSRLHQIGGRLILCNLDPSVYELCQAACVTDILDLRVSAYQTN